MSKWRLHDVRRKYRPAELNSDDGLLLRVLSVPFMSRGPLKVEWKRVKEWMPERDIGEHIYALEQSIYDMQREDVRRQRDSLAESLTQIRGRIVCAIRDERLPESVRDLLVCLLHGQGIDHAIEEGFVGQDHRPEHQDAQEGGEADQAGGRDRTGEGGQGGTEEVTRA